MKNNLLFAVRALGALLIILGVGSAIWSVATVRTPTRVTVDAGAADAGITSSVSCDGGLCEVVMEPVLIVVTTNVTP